MRPLNLHIHELSGETFMLVMRYVWRNYVMFVLGYIVVLM